ncbi:MAG: hypothetical protein AAGF54_05920 [Pseudomonadota bacterium]
MNCKEIYLKRLVNIIDDKTMLELILRANDGTMVLGTNLVTSIERTNPNSNEQIKKTSRVLWDTLESHVGEITSSDQSDIALMKALFIDVLEEYANGKLATKRLCEIVSSVNLEFDYPDWCDALYDGCDDFSRNIISDEDRTYLEVEVKNLLLEITGQ